MGWRRAWGSIQAVITKYLAPPLCGQSAFAFEANAVRLGKAATRNFAAKGAIESAILDAAGKTLGSTVQRTAWRSGSATGWKLSGRWLRRQQVRNWRKRRKNSDDASIGSSRSSSASRIPRPI